MTKDAVLVSVCMIAYNLEEFVSRAIESVLMQRTNFKYELVIGEDMSTDSTLKICLQYEEKYGEKIRVLRRKVNLGMVPNFMDTLENCRGKYIALLEGDDCWVSPLKLQDQIDILEQSPKISLCAHNAIVLYPKENNPNIRLFSDSLPAVVDTEYLLKNWCFPTGSIVFKRDKLTLPPWFKDIRNWDWAIEILLSSKGEIYYDPEPLSIYRKHLGGNSFNPEYSNSITFKRLVTLLELLDEYFLKSYSVTINEKIVELKKEILKTELKNKSPFLYYTVHPQKIFYGMLRKILLSGNK